jgi:hypothetical protein
MTGEFIGPLVGPFGSVPRGHTEADGQMRTGAPRNPGVSMGDGAEVRKMTRRRSGSAVVTLRRPPEGPADTARAPRA